METTKTLYLETSIALRAKAYAHTTILGEEEKLKALTKVRLEQSVSKNIINELNGTLWNDKKTVKKHSTKLKTITLSETKNHELRKLFNFTHKAFEDKKVRLNNIESKPWG